MAKSWIVGGRGSGDPFDAPPGYFQIGSSLENDLVGPTRVTIPENLTARNLSVRIGAITITGGCTVVIRKNNTTDTALAITFDETEDNTEKRLTGVDVTFAQGDDWVGKVFGAGTGTVSVTMCAIEIEPDDPNSTLSFLCGKKQSSTSISIVGSTFFAPFGSRSTNAVEVFDGTESTGAAWQSVGTFTAIYFQIATGTNTRTGTVTARTRKNEVNGGSSISILGTDDGRVLVDTSGTTSLVDGDEFAYSVELGAGTGTMNVESIGCWLRSANGEFLLAVGNFQGIRADAGVTRYWHMAGEGAGSLGSEPLAQLTAPFDMAIRHMQVFSNRSRTTGPSTATFRKNGSATELSVSLPSSGGAIGIFEDTGTVNLNGGTDLVNSQFTTGTGTNRDWNYIVYLAEEIPAAIDKSHTTGALIEKRISETHTTTALLEDERSLSHGTNSRLRATLAKTHSANALIEKVQIVAHTTSASMQTALAAQVIFHDGFDSAISTALESHTPTIAGNAWIKRGAVGLRATSDDRLQVADLTVASAAALYECDPAATDQDIDLEIVLRTIPNFGGTDDPFMFFARMDLATGPSLGWYSAGAYQNGSALNLRIFKNVAGTVTQLAAADFNLGLNDLVTMEVRGPASATTVRILVNGTERLSCTPQNEPTLSGLGYGFGLGNRWITSDDANASWIFDDFKVTTYAGEREISHIHGADALIRKPTDRVHTSDALALLQRLHRTDAAVEIPLAERVIFNDAFTGPANSALENHIPDLVGISWNKVEPVGLFVDIAPGTLKASATVASARALYTCLPPAEIDDIDIQINIRIGSDQPGGDDDPWQLFARYTDLDNWYSGGAFQNENISNLKLFKNVGGVKTLLATTHLDLAGGDIIKLRVRGPATATRVSLLVNGNEELVAPIQDEPTLTGKLYGFGEGSNWLFDTHDVNITWVFDRFRAIEFIAAEGTKTIVHTADALIALRDTKTHTSNALLQRPTNRIHTTNALTTSADFRTHSTDSELWIEIVPISGHGPIGRRAGSTPTDPGGPYRARSAPSF